ncbi:MAG: DUF305 domain-containing protein, partial [Actinomycetota bacterium]
MRRAIVLGITVALAGLLAVGCSSHSSHSSSVTIPADATFNAADVAFAQGMIPHHRQAIDMAELVPSRGTSPEVAALAQQIAAAQGPEIATMTSWLQAWDQVVPVDMGMDHSTHDMGAMDGMMSADDMERLGGSKGAAFDRMWVEMMIVHHEGALTMAQREVAEGKDPAAVALAR